MSDGTIAREEISGGFYLPIGVRFLNQHDVPLVIVSTVCLDGAHLRDPLGICSSETGYETMVFLNGSTLMSVYTRKYATLQEAQKGHEESVMEIRAKTLTLSIPISY